MFLLYMLCCIVLCDPIHQNEFQAMWVVLAK